MLSNYHETIVYNTNLKTVKKTKEINTLQIW